MGEIEQHHHIIPTKQNGSNMADNIVGLCLGCHKKVHKSTDADEKMKELKPGKKKKPGTLVLLKRIGPALVKELTKLTDTYVVSNKEIAEFRKMHKLEKSCMEDAYCIACLSLKEPVVVTGHAGIFELRQFRRHDRRACKQENLKRKYLLDGKTVAVNRHKAADQKEDSLEEYRANGGDTSRLKVKKHFPTYNRFDRIMPGALLRVGRKIKVLQGAQGLHNGVPDYYEFTDGTKARSGKCRVVINNTGLVFV